MFKALANGLLLLATMSLMSVACCKEPTLDYANLQALRLYLYEPTPGGLGQLQSGARTIAPRLDLTPHFDYEYLALAPTAAPFISQATALQCEVIHGAKGLKERAIAAELTSTNTFNGVAPGQPLDQFVRCKMQIYGRDTAAFPLAQLADLLNTVKGDDLRFPFVLRLSPKPRDNARQQFELRIRLESGREVVQTTPEIFWE